MIKFLSTFIKYNNAVPVILIVLFLGFSGAMAANPEVREGIADGIVSKEKLLVSVDNSFITNINLDIFEPSVQITEVTEDDENYYIGYSIQTIGLKDGAWGEVNRSSSFTIPKVILRDEDLGLYATKELGEVVSREIEKLKETQIFEKRNGISQKVVATTYSGLVGRFFNAKEDVFGGYEPVLVSRADTSSEATQTTSVIVSTQKPSTKAASGGSGAKQVSTSSGATMVMNGNNPSRVPTNSTGSGYSDNGASAKDNQLQDLSVYIKVNGVSMSEVSIDTRTPGVYMVLYTATDHGGESMMLERVVIVYDQYKMKEPALIISGDQTVFLQERDNYIDAGAKAIDYDDGDLTHAITAENTVNTGIPGEYEVRYSVTDSDNNIVTATRRVVVAEKEKSSQDTSEEVGVNGTSTNSSN